MRGSNQLKGGSSNGMKSNLFHRSKSDVMKKTSSFRNEVNNNGRRNSRTFICPIDTKEVQDGSSSSSSSPSSYVETSNSIPLIIVLDHNQRNNEKESNNIPLLPPPAVNNTTITCKEESLSVDTSLIKEEMRRSFNSSSSSSPQSLLSDSCESCSFKCSTDNESIHYINDEDLMNLDEFLDEDIAWVK